MILTPIIICSLINFVAASLLSSEMTNAFNITPPTEETNKIYQQAKSDLVSFHRLGYGPEYKKKILVYNRHFNYFNHFSEKLGVSEFLKALLFDDDSSNEFLI